MQVDGKGSSFAERHPLGHTAGEIVWHILVLLLQVSPKIMFSFSEAGWHLHHTKSRIVAEKRRAPIRESQCDWTAEST